MRNPIKFRILAPTALAILAATGPAVARDADPTPPTVVVRGDDGSVVAVTLDDGTLTVVSDEDGHESVRMIDLEAMALLADDALDDVLQDMDGLGDLLASLQVQWRAGQDNRMNIAVGDAEFEFDFDALAAEVSAAVTAGLADFDGSGWVSSGDRRDTAPEAELRQELDDLKAEMRELRRELARQKERGR